MIDFQGSKKAVYPVGELPNAWDKTIPTPTVAGHYEYGPRLRTKMVEFLKHTVLLRPEYNHYISLGAAREPDETYDMYKIRQRFQQALMKYRTIVKNSIFINTVEKLQNEQRQAENKAI